MSEILEMMDEFGPEEVVCVQDTRTGMRGCLVRDNSARGFTGAACRMAPDLKLSTCVPSRQDHDLETGHI